jgi:transcriptional regulator
MYLRVVHAEFDVRTLRAFIIQNPLGLLVTALSSADFPTLQCTHVPWILDIQDHESETELGVLRGHLARANPHSKALSEAAKAGSPKGTNGFLEKEVTVVFNGPAHSYVTPKFYVETKPATGKVVPTWDYSAVQVYGKAKIFFDSSSEETGAFLQTQVTDLTNHMEEDVFPQMSKTSREATPWKVSDAPPEYVQALKKSIIGIEITVERLEGKYKMTQEMGQGDRAGVIEGFEGLDTELGCLMAKTVTERGEKKDAEKTS